MLEPRGHEGMYGAILVQDTELTLSGEADIGVLFCHNGGYFSPSELLSANMHPPRGLLYDVWSRNDCSGPFLG